MNFNIITPIVALDTYATYSRNHLVLQHIKKAEYCEFYRKRRIAGDTLILDNGAYEGAKMPTTEDYRLAIEYYQPQIVVVPDYLLQPWHKTLNAARLFLDAMNGTLTYEPKWLYIPQAEPGKREDWYRSLDQILDDSRISWIGLPRALSTHIARDRLERVLAARLIRRIHPHISVHAFGMVDGDIHELPYLEDAGVKSVDSSAPVWRGWHKYSLTDRSHMKTWANNGTECDFYANVAPWPDEHEVILHNLEACGVRVK